MCAFEFQLIIIIDDVTAAILDEKTRALSRPQFSSDFLEILNIISVALYEVWDCISAIYVINYDNELKFKRTHIDLLGIIFEKFH